MRRRSSVASSMLLRSGREPGPVVMVEIAVLGAGRDNQKVVRHGAGLRRERSWRSRSTPSTSARITVVLRLPAQNAANRRGDVGRRKARGRHLVEQGLEEMIVVTVDHGHVDRRIRERLCRREAGKACPDDDDALAA